jgi:hypothetical protein
MRTLAIVLLLSPLGAQAAQLDPGTWELSATTTVQGMPGALGPVIQTRCFNEADARDPGRVLGPQAGAACEFSNQRDTGSEFTFDVSCGGAAPLRGSGKARYGREFLDAELDLGGNVAGQNFNSRSRITGRRLGAC